MAEPYIGQRVNFLSLMYRGELHGTIASIDDLSGLCDVAVQEKNGNQLGIVSSTKFYESKPPWFNTSLWQVCWPFKKEEPNA